MKKTFLISNDYAARDLLSFLKNRLFLSSKTITKLKRQDDGILINSTHVTVRYRLCAGDILELNLSEPDVENSNVVSTEAKLDILYEDDDILVVNKPYNMPTHPSHGHFDDTLANAVSFYYKSRGIPFVFRAVNRLDRNTSGAVLIAKNQFSAGILNRQMKNSEIEKTYIALLCGELKADHGKIETYIRRKQPSVIFREVCEKCEEADYALTEYNCIGESEDASLAVVYPHTGRTHQLRVHFAHIGHPLLGDDLYGNAHPDFTRHALHAYSLRFMHPAEKREITVYAPLPEDMKRFILTHFPDVISSDLIKLS